MKEFKVRLIDDEKVINILADAVRVENNSLLFFIGNTIVVGYASGCWEAVFNVELVKSWKAEEPPE
jgi:hypothetical protein